MHRGSPQWVRITVTVIRITVITKKGLTLAGEPGGPSLASTPDSQVPDSQDVRARQDPASLSTGPSWSSAGGCGGGFRPALLPSSRSEKLDSADGCCLPHSQPKVVQVPLALP